MIRRYVKIQGVSISLGESALFLAAGFLAFIIAVFPWSAVARVMKAVSAPVARGMKAVSAHAARGGKAGLATARGMKAKTFKRIAVATIIVLTATISMFAIIYVMLEDHATHRSWKVFKAHQHMKKLAWGARDFHKAERKSNNGKTLKPRFPKSTKWTPAKTCCSMSGQDRCDPDNFYNDRPTDQNLKSIEQKGWVEIAGPKKDRMKLWWVRDDPPATFRFKMKRSKNKKKMTIIGQGVLDCADEPKEFRIELKLNKRGEVDLKPEFPDELWETQVNNDSGDELWEKMREELLTDFVDVFDRTP